MKKFISLILSVMLLVSCCGAFAEDTTFGYTPQNVLEWMEENDQYAEGALEQAVNVSHRLAEMIIYIAGINASEEQVETLGEIINTLAEARESDEISPNQSLATGCMGVTRALVVLAQESDPNGVYQANLDSILEAHDANDDAVETADGQSINALFTAVKVTALICEEASSSQDQIDQIEAGLQECSAEADAAASADEQLAVGAKWLRKMLGAFSKLMNPGCADDIDEELRLKEEYIAEVEATPLQTAFQYLTSSVYAMAVFTGYYTFT